MEYLNGMKKMVDKIKVSEKFRNLFQGLAVLGGLILVITSIVVIFRPEELPFLIGFAIFYGSSTIIADSWFLIKT